MTLRVDQDNIAEAMRQAALKARSGMFEEQAGRFIDEALIRATRQATQGPPELRAGRYEPDRAARFEADQAKRAGQ